MAEPQENYVAVGGLRVEPALYNAIQGIAEGTGKTGDQLIEIIEGINDRHGGQDAALMQTRDDRQELIDKWHQANPFPFQGDQSDDTYQAQLGEYLEAQKSHLTEIGYIEDAVADYRVNSGEMDPEILDHPGPQLVVPVDKARLALKAANARWGGAYDAHAEGETFPSEYLPEGYEIGAAENDVMTIPDGRSLETAVAEAVIRHTDDELSRWMPLQTGTHHQVSEYHVEKSGDTYRFAATLDDGTTTYLADESQFVGFTQQDEAGKSTILLKQDNGLHIELNLSQRAADIGGPYHSNLETPRYEAALTTIFDAEDSVAAVDGPDKATVYSNWDGLMMGTLAERVAKGDTVENRTLEPDRQYIGADGTNVTLPGRVLHLFRTVGAHMYTGAITTAEGAELPEAFIDTVIMAASAQKNLNGLGKYQNSAANNIYLVKPKQQGASEVAATNAMLGDVEQQLGLDYGTIKMGIMDEERRTTVNLPQAINAARDRVFFINTGFLDRTGDDIHHNMHAGPMMPRSEIKTTAPYMVAYEAWNVAHGVAAGVPQIGKGMWAANRDLQGLMAQKGGQLEAGATTAWVPGPTAATLHSIHYRDLGPSIRSKHAEVKAILEGPDRAEFLDGLLMNILTPAVRDPSLLTDEQRQAEVDNNLQGMIGYVDPWVNEGVGCSSILDINDVGQMEDRATLRIASQHLANWILHGVVSREYVEDRMAVIAGVVDDQRRAQLSGEALEAYQPIDLQGVSMETVRNLIDRGLEESSGLTERSLNEGRLKAKRQAA